MRKRDFLALLDDDLQFSCATPPPSRTQVAQLERRLGRSLPKAYRDFLLRWGAAVIQVNETLWPRPSPNSVAPAWTFYYGFVVLGIGKGAPSWLKVDRVVKRFHREFPGTEGLLPFFHWISAEARLCFDANDRIIWWHPDEPTHWLPVKESFDHTLRRSIRALKNGKRGFQLGKPIDQVNIPQFDPLIRRSAL